ncbi:MAG: DUF108 domain-containing protein [Candidatus Omnitrophica bacterium]|nr:DUF108 domain-containing protein [Candidatus Omnitrophota bacterium]
MKKTKIGIVGCGGIGTGVACFVDKNLKDKVFIYAICDVDSEKACVLKKKLKAHPKVLGLDDLIKSADLIVEVASKEAAKLTLAKAIKYKKDVMILSVGALIENKALIKKADACGINIYIPSGAICGVDGLGALSVANIKDISLITSKPPKGLIGADYLKNKKIDLNNLKKEKVVFNGSVNEAIKHFPKNINVAAILLLVSNFSKVNVCIKADPKIKRNTHRIEINAKEAKICVEVANVPSSVNPKTSTLAILSAQYMLKKIFSSLKIGN